MTTPIHITFQPSKADYEAIVQSYRTDRFQMPGKGVGLFLAFIVLLAIGLILIELNRNFPGHEARKTHAYAVFIGFYACLIWWRISADRTRKRLLKTACPDEDHSEEIHVSLGPDGIKTTSEGACSSRKWSHIDTVVRISGTTVLHFGANGFAIPDRALPDGLTPADFREAIEQWRQA